MASLNDAIIDGLMEKKGAFRTKCLIAVVLASLGFLGNFYNIDLAFGVNFLFGSIFTVLALLALGPMYAIFVSVIASSYTIYLWGHPVAFVIFTGEAIFLSLVTARAWPRRDILLMDLVFWITLGMPTVLVIYNSFLDMPNGVVNFIAIKQAVNGITNVMLAYIVLLIARPVLANFPYLRPGAKLWRIATMVSVGLSFSLIVPAMLVLVSMNGWALEREMKRYKTQLNEITTHEVWAIEKQIKTDLDKLQNVLSGQGYLAENENLRAGQKALNALYVMSATGELWFERQFAETAHTSFETLREALDWARDMHGRARNATSIYALETEAGNPIVVGVLDDPEHPGTLVAVWDSSYIYQIVGSVNLSGQTMGLALQGSSNLPAALTGGFRQSEYLDVLFPTTDAASKVHLWREAQIVSSVPLASAGGASLVTFVSLRPVIDGVQSAITTFLVASFYSIVFALFVVACATLFFQRGVSRAMVHAEARIKRPNEDRRFLSEHFLLEGRWLSRWLDVISEDLVQKTDEQERIANDLTQLIDTANAPIFGIDAEGRVNEWNQTAERITGFTKDEVMGEDLVGRYITDDYKESVKEVLDKALAGEQTANYEFPLFTKSGDRVDVLLNSTTRRDATGKIVGVVGVGQDITETKKSQAQVIHASKLATLGEMATSVAHELNQPLNVIRLAAGNCRMRLGGLPGKHEFFDAKLNRIEEQTERAATIIDHMRMFGRKTLEDATELQVCQVVRNALHLVGEQLRLSAIEIELNLPADCGCRVIGHSIQLEQVILNLLTNARDAILAHSSDKKKISIRVEKVGDHIVVSLQDTGGGIPEKIRDRVFEPFFTTKEMGKGTGLGLSISYGIVSDMNGTIQVQNTESGANFEIILPSVEGSADQCVS